MSEFVTVEVHNEFARRIDDERYLHHQEFSYIFSKQSGYLIE